jgi:hypothetical protein
MNRIDDELIPEAKEGDPWCDWCGKAGHYEEECTE